jgi:hypothetical protein
LPLRCSSAPTIEGIHSVIHLTAIHGRCGHGIFPGGLPPPPPPRLRLILLSSNPLSTSASSPYPWVPAWSRPGHRSCLRLRPPQGWFHPLASPREPSRASASQAPKKQRKLAFPQGQAAASFFAPGSRALSRSKAANTGACTSRAQDSPEPPSQNAPLMAKASVWPTVGLVAVDGGFQRERARLVWCMYSECSHKNTG